MLSMYPSTKIYFVAPPVVRMKDDIKNFLTAKGIAWEEVRGGTGAAQGPGCGRREWVSPAWRAACPPSCPPARPTPLTPPPPPTPTPPHPTPPTLHSCQVDDLNEVASDVDVLYMTRIQKERFTNMDEYAAARGECGGGLRAAQAGGAARRRRRLAPPPLLWLCRRAP
jgi:hypothetical protein